MVYQDKRGWIFFVRAGLGENNFKAFYTKTAEDYKSGIRSHGVKSLEYRKSIKEAEMDLKEYAAKHKMKVYEEVE